MQYPSFHAGFLQSQRYHFQPADRIPNAYGNFCDRGQDESQHTPCQDGKVFLQFQQMFSQVLNSIRRPSAPAMY